MKETIIGLQDMFYNFFFFIPHNGEYQKFVAAKLSASSHLFLVNSILYIMDMCMRVRVSAFTCVRMTHM